MSTVRASVCTALCVLCVAMRSAAADVTLSEGTNIGVDVAADGRVVMDLLGGVWILPRHGGDARAVLRSSRPAIRPRFSPDDERIAFEARLPSGSELWLHDIGDRRTVRLSAGTHPDRHPEWHPEGERITFASARDDDGFDLWEIDLATGLEWRLSNRPGDETEPAWSHDGRHLVFVHAHRGRYALVLRRHGLPDVELEAGAEPLAAPSWRPDGSLITYLKKNAGEWSVWMSILSTPPLSRPLIEDDDLFVAPVAWPDRQRLLYTAGGKIRERRFDAWSSSTIPFRARVDRSNGFAGRRALARDLPTADLPSGRTVIRAARMFDGASDGYRRDVDIVIDNGRIAAIEKHAARPDAIVIDLGDVTVLPGYVDTIAALPPDAGPALGPLLLGLGITTMVADHPHALALDAIWSGKTVPGPRLLAARSVEEVSDDDTPWLLTAGGDAERQHVAAWQRRGVAVLADSWQVGVATGASLLPGTATRPASPAGRRYQDSLLATGSGDVRLVSGLADAATPGVREIVTSRIARLIAPELRPRRRVTAVPDLSAAADAVVLGSFLNGLPPGIAVHAELRALVAAGLEPRTALRAAGINAAAALGLDAAGIGRIASGAVADLVVIDGDPLAAIDDAQDIVAVVRNGRFYSVSGLIDRAEAAKNVEILDKNGE